MAAAVDGLCSKEHGQVTGLWVGERPWSLAGPWIEKGTGRSPVPRDYSRGVGGKSKSAAGTRLMRSEQLQRLRGPRWKARGGQLRRRRLHSAAPEAEGALGGDGDGADEQFSAEAGLEVATGGRHAIEDADRIRAAGHGEAERELGHRHAGHYPIG